MSIELSAPDFYDACVCLGFARAARTIARRYDSALKPAGITSGQFSILSALLRDKPVALGDLAGALGMDRTTLSRNLKPLETDGLIATTPDARDARVRRLALTHEGRARVDAAIPLWRQAQAESNRRIDHGDWTDLRAYLRDLS